MKAAYMNTATFQADIPASLATNAFHGVSFHPEDRGQRTRNDYAATLTSDYAVLRKLAEREKTLDLLDAEFARYREGYAKRYRAYLASNARCVSWMIAGPSNFPTRRMEKRNDVANKRLNELIEFRERALDAIRKTLCPSLRPIMAGDSDAVSRLQDEITRAEQMQARMKVANQVVRTYRGKDETAGIAKLVEQGFTEQQAVKLFEPDFCGRYGFPDYALTNNSANLRRMKLRLAQISRAKAQKGFEAQGENARLEDCPAENRVRLFYAGKPDVETRDRLKKTGFRWSPTLGCWQAYRHQHTYDFAKREAGVTEEQVKAALSKPTEERDAYADLLPA
jgi:hypothetical protein